jgi:hypothetical protein
MTAAIASISFNSYAQHGQDVSAPHKAEAQQKKQDKQESKDEKKESKEQQALALRNALLMEQQKRRAQYRYQQAYYEQLRQQQAQLENDRHDYENDPYYYTPPAYQYRRGAEHDPQPAAAAVEFRCAAQLLDYATITPRLGEGLATASARTGCYSFGAQ